MEKHRAHRHPVENKRAFRNALLKWFQENGKSYPWRETTDPWSILVSEIMLQQTTVASVLANRRFEKFLQEFPCIETIAAASEKQILRAWEGLGYYNRVRNLQKTAQALLHDFEGQFPSDAQTLETLPGIGRYTAGAVSSFAFDKPAPIVDGNIARVLSRLLDCHEETDSTIGQKIIWKTAGELLDSSKPRLFNSALMELGQTLCSPKSPGCLICPVRDFCQSSAPESLPIKKPRKKFVRVNEHAFFWIEQNQLLLSMGHDSRRKGFWKLPLRSPEECAHLDPVSTHRYTITHHKVTLHLYHSKPPHLVEGEEYHSISDLTHLPVATPIRKILAEKATELGL
ncbi:A/G-specific adenine glycosylase [Akkermansiaceae bacterium]|nr:A/G-specific adenine glycosylase [Akkermansiaceae bacterium]